MKSNCSCFSPVPDTSPSKSTYFIWAYSTGKKSEIITSENFTYCDYKHIKISYLIFPQSLQIGNSFFPPKESQRNYLTKG